MQAVCPLKSEYKLFDFLSVTGIMGIQGKIAQKQSSKICIFLHSSVLSFIFKKKLSL